MYLMLFLCGDGKAATFNNLFEFYSHCDRDKKESNNNSDVGEEGLTKDGKEYFNKKYFKGFLVKVFTCLCKYSYTMGAWPKSGCNEEVEEKCGNCCTNITDGDEVDKVVNAVFGDNDETTLTSAELCTKMTENEKVSKMNLFNPRGWRSTFLGEAFQKAEHLEKPEPVVEDEEEEVKEDNEQLNGGEEEEEKKEELGVTEIEDQELNKQAQGGGD